MSGAPENYFLVNRQLLQSDRWLAEKFTRAQAWVDLFGLAQHSDSYFMVRGIKVEVKRTQLAYSQLSLAERWHWSRDKVRRFLKCLENDGDIIQQNNEVTTLITITNYNYWQGTSEKTIQQTIQQKNNRKTSNNTHTINDKNDKNDNKHNKTVVFEYFFQKLWKSYPRRIGRASAFKHYLAQVKSKEDYRILRIAINKYKDEIAKKGTEEQYIKHGSTFFNNVWKDYGTAGLIETYNLNAKKAEQDAIAVELEERRRLKYGN